MVSVTPCNIHDKSLTLLLSCTTQISRAVRLLEARFALSAFRKTTFIEHPCLQPKRVMQETPLDINEGSLYRDTCLLADGGPADMQQPCVHSDDYPPSTGAIHSSVRLGCPVEGGVASVQAILRTGGLVSGPK